MVKDILRTTMRSRVFSEIYTASKTTLSKRKFLVIFLVLWASFFALMFVIPVRAIPGNDLWFQMGIFRPMDYVMLGVLSFLSALVTVLQINAFLEQKEERGRGSMGSAVTGSAGTFSGVVSSIFTSASCASCVGAVFGFLAGYDQPNQLTVPI